MPLGPEILPPFSYFIINGDASEENGELTFSVPMDAAVAVTPSISEIVEGSNYLLSGYVSALSGDGNISPRVGGANVAAISEPGPFARAVVAGTDGTFKLIGSEVNATVVGVSLREIQ